MKKLIYIVLLSIAVVFAGCTDLTDSDEDGIARETVEGGGSQIDDPAAALSGVYAQLNSFTNQELAPLTLMEHPSDEMMGPTRGTDWSDFGVWRQLHLHTWDPSHSIVLDTWNLINQGVFRATQVIDAESANAQQVAEAKFLRGLFMFYVMDLYGQVPFRASDSGPNDVPEVMSRSEAFNFILNDLQDARPELSTISSGPDAATASQEAVDFLLAKLYLNRTVYTQATPDNPTTSFSFSSEDMNEVIERVNNIQSNGFLALDDYWENFYVNNTAESSEMVFALANEPDDAPAPVSNFHHMTLHYNQRPSSWNGFTTISEFYSNFDGEAYDSDVRKNSEIPEVKATTGLDVGFLVGQQVGPDDRDGDDELDLDSNGDIILYELTDRGGNDLEFTEEVDLFYSNERMGIRVIKYPPEATPYDENVGTVLGTDFIVFRYADARLMKAEALMRGGTDPQGETALGIVNDLRTQRGASTLSSIDEETMLAERGRELYWEGWRRQDQIRFGTFTDAWTGKEQSQDFRVLFPIPQQAMDTNPNLIQNSGY